MFKFDNVTINITLNASTDSGAIRDPHDTKHVGIEELIAAIMAMELASGRSDQDESTETGTVENQTTAAGTAQDTPTDNSGGLAAASPASIGVVRSALAHLLNESNTYTYRSASAIKKHLGNAWTGVDDVIDAAVETGNMRRLQKRDGSGYVYGLN